MQEFTSPPPQPSFGAAPPFAPRPQPSTFSSTPILAQQLEEEEPQVIKYAMYSYLMFLYLSLCLFRDWREKQADEIKARDEASKAKREETIAKAERSIDQFYEEYASKKEKAIRENKCVQISINGIPVLTTPQGPRRKVCFRPHRFALYRDDLGANLHLGRTTEFAEQDHRPCRCRYYRSLAIQGSAPAIEERRRGCTRCCGLLGVFYFGCIICTWITPN